MVKKTNKIVCFARILSWKLPKNHFGFPEDWRNFGNPQKSGKFLKLGVARILRYLLTDALYKQNWLQKEFLCINYP